MHKERESDSENKDDQDDKCYSVEYSRSNDNDMEVLEYYYAGRRVIKHVANRTITSQVNLSQNQTTPRKSSVETSHLFTARHRDPLRQLLN